MVDYEAVINRLIDNHKTIKEVSKDGVFKFTVILGNGFRLSWSWHGATPRSLIGESAACASRVIKKRFWKFNLSDNRLQEVINGI